MVTTIKKRPVAVFDIDGTIFRSSLFIEITEAFIEEGIFPNKVKDEYYKEFLNWQHRKGGYNDYLDKMVQAYMTNVKGVNLKNAICVANKVLEIQKHKVYSYTRDLIKDLKNTHFMLAISHSPFFIAEPFAKDIGFDKTYAVFYEEDNGILNGNIKDEDLIFNKGKILKRAVEKENLSLKGSFCVGDSESDIQILKLVENPIAFNPSSKLYNVAKRNKWKIIVERKDVIYEI